MGGMEVGGGGGRVFVGVGTVAGVTVMNWREILGRLSAMTFSETTGLMSAVGARHPTQRRESTKRSRRIGLHGAVRRFLACKYG